MPTPSKFSAGVGARIVELLASGHSRRQASKAVGISHSQLTRWVQRGDKVAGSGSRYDVFAQACHLAETPSDPPMLVGLRREYDRWSSNPVEAWRYLERIEPGFGRSDPPEPIELEVVLGPTIRVGDLAYRVRQAHTVRPVEGDSA